MPTQNQRNLKIGDTVWVCDGNRRVYPKGALSADKWKQWRPCKVTGETARSFEVNGGKKGSYGFLIPKNGTEATTPYACGRPVYSVAEIEMAEFLYENLRLIEAACRDTGKLRAVNALLGIVVPKAPEGAIDQC